MLNPETVMLTSKINIIHCKKEVMDPDMKQHAYIALKVNRILKYQEKVNDQKFK